MPLGAPINAATIDDNQAWRQKLLKTLQTNYGSAAHFKETMALLQPLILAPETNLCRFNIGAITAVAAHLGISARFVRQSELAATGKGTELLIALVKAVHGDAYLAGGGASGYQKDELFPTHGLTLVTQNFRTSSYGPTERFAPGLSVIDYLMHEGCSIANAFSCSDEGSRAAL